jgi:hypothetical protein
MGARSACAEVRLCPRAGRFGAKSLACHACASQRARCAPSQALQRPLGACGGLAGTAFGCIPPPAATAATAAANRLCAPPLHARPHSCWVGTHRISHVMGQQTLCGNESNAVCQVQTACAAALGMWAASGGRESDLPPGTTPARGARLRTHARGPTGRCAPALLVPPLPSKRCKGSCTPAAWQLYFSSVCACTSVRVPMTMRVCMSAVRCVTAAQVGLDEAWLAF